MRLQDIKVVYNHTRKRYKLNLRNVEPRPQEKLEIYFYINGSAQSRGETIDFYGGGSNDDNVRFTTSATFVLTETDYVEIYVRHNEGASQPIDGGSSQANSYTFFAGYRVSGGVPGTS